MGNRLSTHRRAHFLALIYKPSKTDYGESIINAHIDVNPALGMITSRQLRAARALAGMDQRALAGASGLSLPTIQRMEASEGVIRGNVESLMKLIAALERAGVELINEGAASERGGRGVRLKVHH